MNASSRQQRAERHRIAWALHPDHGGDPAAFIAAMAAVESPPKTPYSRAVRRDRGSTVIDITARADPNLPLDDAVTAAQSALDQLHALLGGVCPPLRMHLHTSRRRPRTRHVH